MNPEIKKKWLTALRSRKYKKGTGALRYKDLEDPDGQERFCCLGVLCEIAVIDGIIPKPTITTAQFNGTRISYAYGEDNKTYLPVPVRRWAGLSSMYPKIPGTTHTLASLNDERKTFRSIIKAIEEHF